MSQVISKFYLDLEEKQQVLALWDSEYPALLNLSSVEGLEKYFAKTTEHHHYMVKEGKRIEGWCMVFKRDGVSWFSILIDPQSQRRGIGNSIMQKVFNDYPKLLGWVVVKDGFRKADGALYESPLSFYRKLGFEAQYDIVFERNGLEAIRIKYERN